LRGAIWDRFSDERTCIERQSAPRGRRLSVDRRALFPLLCIAGRLATGGDARWVHLLPAPLELVQRAGELWLSGAPSALFLGTGVFNDILPSLARLLAGWSLAAAVGILVGVLIGRSRAFSDLLDPSLQFLRAVPGPALIPMFLILLGTESTMRISLIAFGSVWPVLLNTIEGVRTVDPLQIETARAFKLPAHARLFRVILPAAMPKMFAGLRVSFSLAIILMVVSEFVASTNGIGYRILVSQIMLQLTDMWCGIVLLAVLGLSLNFVFEWIEHHTLRWHRGARQRTPI
jgi:ABC-type nitrate/sulfonate/bicarbonate transport system permease component